MKVLGFSFTKIGIEKNKENSAKVKVNTKIDLSSVSEVKEGLIKIEFSYNINYEENLANIILKGFIFILPEDEKLKKEILKEWKDNKNKEVTSFKINVINLILRKANIKALSLEEEMGLIPHIPLPSFKKK